MSSATTQKSITALKESIKLTDTIIKNAEDMITMINVASSISENDTSSFCHTLNLHNGTIATMKNMKQQAQARIMELESDSQKEIDAILDRHKMVAA